MDSELKSLLDRFETLAIKAGTFAHQDHIQVAWAMLATYPFMEAVTRYANTIRAMAANAGAADKFNTTITVAFMALVAERMNRSPEARWPVFKRDNPDLFSKDVLNRWYTTTRLTSPLAREQFLLPDVVNA